MANLYPLQVDVGSENGLKLCRGKSEVDKDKTKN